MTSFEFNKWCKLQTCPKANKSPESILFWHWHPLLPLLCVFVDLRLRGRKRRHKQSKERKSKTKKEAAAAKLTLFSFVLFLLLCEYGGLIIGKKVVLVAAFVGVALIHTKWLSN